jgi:hypothetical protein
MVFVKRQIRKNKTNPESRIVVKGRYRINVYTGPKLQESVIFKDAVTKGDFKRFSENRKGHKKYKLTNNRVKRVRINVNLIKPDPEDYGYYAIHAPRSNVYVYATEKTELLAEFVNISIGQHEHPPINETNYVDIKNPPPLYAVNNIGFFLMIVMPFHGIKYLVSNIFAFETNDEFQQNIFTLMTGFGNITGFPLEKVACYAINKPPTERYAVYAYSVLFGDGIWKDQYGTEEWISTIMNSSTFNSMTVNLIDEYSENSESENRIIGGPLEDLLKNALGIKKVGGEENGDPEEHIDVEVEEEEEEGGVEEKGGTRKKKRKTKRKKQRSKRRKHRSQKKH